MKDFEETRKGERRTARAPAEAAGPGGLELASAVGNRGMQQLAESPAAGRVGPAGLSGSGAVLARTSDEGEEDAGHEEPSGAEEAADLSTPEAEEDPTVD